MARRLYSTRLLFLCISIITTSYLWGADSRKDTEKELRNHFENNIYILRNFYIGDNLKYSPDGILVSGGKTGIWSLHGFVKVKNLNVNKDKIELKGERLLWSYAQKSNNAIYLGSNNIKIEIGPFVSPPDIPSSYKAIQNVFLKKDEFSMAVPSYWESFVRKEFGDGNTPDDVTTNKNPLFPNMITSPPKSVPKGLIKASKLITTVEPIYPEIAKRFRVSGTVIFIVNVDEGGIPTVADIVRPLGVGIEENAIEAISQWRYSPTYLDGKAIPVTATITVNFVLGR